MTISEKGKKGCTDVEAPASFTVAAYTAGVGGWLLLSKTGEDLFVDIDLGFIWMIFRTRLRGGVRA